MTPSNYDPLQGEEAVLDEAPLEEAGPRRTTPANATPGSPAPEDAESREGAPEAVIPEEGKPEAGAPEAETPEEGTPEEGATEEGATEEETPLQGTMGEGTSGESTQGTVEASQPAQAGGPPGSGPRRRTSPGTPTNPWPEPAERGAAVGPTRLRVPHPVASPRHGRREPLPSQRDHAEYSRIPVPVPEPTASRVVPMLLLVTGLGAAAYLGLVVRHYPLAIFLVLISLVAAPLARMIFRGSID